MDKYRVDIAWSEEDQAFIARAPELDGVVTHGASVSEAAEHLEEAIALHLESLAAHHEPAPEPVSLKKLSGQYALRMGRELHEKLTIESNKTDRSINELVIEYIARHFFREDKIISTGRAAAQRKAVAKLRAPARSKAHARAKGKAG